MDPKIFSGNTDEDYTKWAKRVKAYCNTQKAGFRRAPEWAEEQTEQIDADDMTMNNRADAEVADGKLRDLLIMATADDALVIVEACPDHGFEAWRRLKHRFNPP